MRFLNFYGSQAKALVAGARVRAFGEARPGFFGAEMVHPRYRIVRADTPLPEALTPIYPTTAGLPQAALRRLIAQALAQCELDETLPGGHPGRCCACPRFATPSTLCTGRRPATTRARSPGAPIRRGGA